VHFLLTIDTECHDETCDEMLTITLTYPVSASRELRTHVRSHVNVPLTMSLARARASNMRPMTKF
jgi:hypothetical protein